MNKNPGLAAILSFFVVGLGQIYNGQIGKGLLMLVVYYAIAILAWVFFWGGLFSVDSDSILTGIVGAPILGILVVCIWISGIVDAYRHAEIVNQGGSKKKSPKKAPATAADVATHNYDDRPMAKNIGIGLLTTVSMLMAYISIPILATYSMLELSPIFAKLKLWLKWVITIITGFVLVAIVAIWTPTDSMGDLVSALAIGIIPALVVVFATTKRFPQLYLRLLVSLLLGLLVGMVWFFATGRHL